MCGLCCFCIGFSCLVLEHLWKFLGFLGVKNRHECYCQWHIYVAWNPLTPSKTQPTFCSEKFSPVRQCANILVNTEASDGIWESSIYCRWPSFLCCCSCTCWWFKTQDLFNGSGTVFMHLALNVSLLYHLLGYYFLTHSFPLDWKASLVLKACFRVTGLNPEVVFAFSPHFLQARNWTLFIFLSTDATDLDSGH